MYATAAEWGVRIRGGLKLTMVEVGKLFADLAEMERALLACCDDWQDGYAYDLCESYATARKLLDT